jgi:hypothetical protein
MTQPDFDALAPRTRRRLMLRAVVRALLTVTLLVVLYYALPMDHEFDTATTVLLLVGLLVFAALVTWQVRAILRSDYPAVQAVQALAVAIPLFLLVFASTYFLMAKAQPGTFTESLTRTDALYFTVTIFATVGFGDITAVTQTARVVTIVQMLLDLIVLGLLIRLVLGAVQTSQRRRAAAQAAGGAAVQSDDPQ